MNGKQFHEELQQLDRSVAREILKPHKRPIGARRAIGKKYIDPRDLPRMGAAIEKRARKAQRRRQAAGL